METISFILDIMLVIAAVAAYMTRPRIGGALAKGLRILLIGILILGFAHMAETILFIVFQVPAPVNEVIHRILVGTGFGFVIAGFARMRGAFEE